MRDIYRQATLDLQLNGPRKRACTFVLFVYPAIAVNVWQ